MTSCDLKLFELKPGGRGTGCWSSDMLGMHKSFLQVEVKSQVSDGCNEWRDLLHAIWSH